MPVTAIVHDDPDYRATLNDMAGLVMRLVMGTKCLACGSELTHVGNARLDVR